MRKSLKQKLKTAGVVGGSLIAFSACNTTPQGRELRNYMGYGVVGMVLEHEMNEFLNSSNSPPGQVVYPNERNTHKQIPMLYTCSDKENSVGQQIFRSGEKIEVRAGLRDYFPWDAEVANKNIHLKSNNSDFCVKNLKVGDGENIIGTFDAKHLAENIGEGEYKNIWYVELNGKWKEIGSINYFVFK